MSTETEDKSVLPWILGIASGIGLWFLLRPKPKLIPVGVTQAAPMPPIASPARFANLESIAIRLDQVKTLYRSGAMTPEQALAEAGGLAAAANAFSSSYGEAASVVYGDVTAFQSQVLDFIQLRAAGTVGSSPA